MLHPVDFIRYVRNTKHNQRIMARIGLNALHDPDAYPVDISELDKLGSLNRSVVAGFMNWCALKKQQKYSWCEDEIRDLVALAALKPIEMADPVD